VEALRVIRRHRLIESFLVEVMHMDWSEVHDDAEALEHAVSDRLVERMADMMGHPDEDPHGDPIPTLDARVAATRSLPLSDAEPGRYRIMRVRDQDAGFLEWLGESGLRPGSVFTIRQVREASGVLSLFPEAGGGPVSIGLDSARKIRVEPHA
jgi:DtxR family Mn-dependent transcriptional regulator